MNTDLLARLCGAIGSVPYGVRSGVFVARAHDGGIGLAFSVREQAGKVNEITLSPFNFDFKVAEDELHELLIDQIEEVLSCLRRGEIA